MMKLVEKIGNLTIWREDHTSFMDHLYRDGASFTLMVYNGADQVARETYYTNSYARDDRAAERKAVERLMGSSFDTYTLEAIRAGLPKLTIEHDGRLISGRIAGFDTVDYFKRIDDTRFFKHFTHRPMM